MNTTSQPGLIWQDWQNKLMTGPGRRRNEQNSRMDNELHEEYEWIVPEVLREFMV